MDNETLKLIAVIVGLPAIAGIAIVAYWYDQRKNPKLAEELRRFFREDPKKLPVVNRTFNMVDLPNLQIAIGQYAESRGIKDRFIGWMGQSLRGLGFQPYFDNSKVGPIMYRNVDIDVDRRMQCMENAIHLLDTTAGKLAAYIRLQGRNIELEVMSPSPDLAAEFIDETRKRASEASVYRGKVISLETTTDEWEEARWVNVRFHRFPPIVRRDIILPEETMALLERNVLSFFQHADVLRRSGRSVKRGLLFHGSPGTGKTYSAKWLAQSLPNLTTVLLSGEQLSLIKECCQMARMLAPSLVIMEDVDLIATAREHSIQPTALHQLLNEMDGLASNAEVIFLLTTNRPEVLEPALANRPGRIDQAIRFPLPDAECRRRLLELYGLGLQMDLEDGERLITKTDGASPAFIQELVRKAALVAAEENSLYNGTVRVTDHHFEAALDELVLSGGELTRNLLGFRLSRQTRPEIRPRA